jgi:NADPH-dependent curcumin reductase CurA
VLSQMNPFGRVALCGLISAYGAAEPPPGPRNIRMILVMRLRVQGLIVFDFAERYGEALADLGRWHQEGRLTFREDVREGRYRRLRRNPGPALHRRQFRQAGAEAVRPTDVACVACDDVIPA